MKKKLLVLFLLPAASLFSQAPAWSWEKISASQSNPQVGITNDIVVDTINHFVYGTGSFAGGSMNFGSGDLPGASGAQSVYLVKRDYSGGLIWAKTFPSDYDNIATGVGVDNAGNVYITGYSQNDSIRFGNQFILNSVSNSQDHTVAYVVKMDANGNAQWIKGSIGGGGVTSNALAVDALGNCYLTGQVVDTTGTFLGSTLSNGAYFMKVNANGTLGWLKQTTPSEQLVSQGTAIAIDRAGDCIFVGTYSDNMMFGNIPVPYTSGSGTWNRFTTKMSSATGAFIWAVGAGVWQGANFNYDVATDSQKNVYLTGFLPVPTQGPNTNAYTQNYFLEKLNASGTSQWIKTYPGAYFDFSGSVAVDKHDNVFAGFSISDTTVYGTYTINTASIYKNLCSQIAIVKFDPAGNVVYAKSQPSDAGSLAICSSVALDETGSAYLDGLINGTGSFDSNPFNTNSYGESVFAKIGGSGVSTGIEEQQRLPEFSFYPNPAAGSVFIENVQAGSGIKVTDVSGKILLETNVSASNNSINVSMLQSGIYILEMASGEARAYKKIIIENK